MKITEISIDGFGIWKGLKLEDLSDKITVFYGRNEAGKTTLLQFIRSMLYGFSVERRQKYLPPLRGGKPGGSLVMETRTGTYNVNRFFPKTDARGKLGPDQIVVQRSDGKRQGSHALKVLLSGVDETVYQNVYAVGLREIQELGTLSDNDASRLLYDLSAGLDRVSLVDVLRELKGSRENLLSPTGDTCEIKELLQRRDQLQRELDDQRQSFNRYSHLSAERGRLGQEISKLEKEHGELEKRGRVTELAFSLRDKWVELSDVRRELHEIGPVCAIENEEVQSLDTIGEEINEKQRERSRLRAKRQRLRDQAAALPINKDLCKQGPRIEALGEQRDWIVSLETQVQQVDGDVEKTHASLRTQQHKLGIKGDQLPEWTTSRNKRVINALREPARSLKDAKTRLARYEKQSAELEMAAQEEADALDVAITEKRDRPDLHESLDAAHNRVGMLRHRLELEERLERMGQQKRELEQESRFLLDEQVMPPWTLAIAGGAFALGMMFLLAGLFMPSSAVGDFGWPLTFLGIAGIIGVFVFKHIMERSAENELEACQRQLKGLEAKVKRATEEREEIDAELPKGGGPLVQQLRKAERDLANLEKLIPVGGTPPPSSDFSPDVADDRGSQLRRAYQEAKRTWHQALHEASLPANLSPRQVKEHIVAGRQLAEEQKKLEQRREESEQRWNELNACMSRVEELLRKCKIEPVSDEMADQVDQLMRTWTEQQDWLGRLEAFRTEAREARREQMSLAGEVQKLQTRRRARLRDAGVETPEEYRQLAHSYAQSEVLNGHRERLESEITTALAGVCTHEELDEQLEGTTAEQLERRWDNVAAKLQQIDNERKEMFEKRGRLSEQLRALAGDRRAAYKALELDSVEQQLKQAVARWQQLAVTGVLLESIRRRYELERQPATLHLASRYLESLTQGQYRRVWTPLDEDELRVDDARGKSLSPDSLSRGTREQLFLSLRLSLVTLYAQRGVKLPLVLDDVLVNFDEDRAHAAAKVLSEFAKAGHQLLVFTCHEHLLGTFKQLGADARRLPERGRTVKKALPKPQKPRPEAKPEPAPLVLEEEVPVPIPEPEPEPTAEPVQAAPVAVQQFVATPPAPEPQEFVPEEAYDERSWEADYEEIDPDLEQTAYAEAELDGYPYDEEANTAADDEGEYEYAELDGEPEYGEFHEKRPDFDERDEDGADDDGKFGDAA